MVDRLFSSAPPKLTPKGHTRYSAKPIPLAKHRSELLRRNMQGYHLGPTDPSQFTSLFVPILTPKPLESLPNGIDFRQVYEQPNEKSMYDPLVRRPAIP